METKETCCQHCLKPMEICLQQDEKLNKPLSAHLKAFDEAILTPYVLCRHEKAVRRILGLYDPISTCYFYLPDAISSRMYYEAMLTLPSCVFGHKSEDFRRLYSRKFTFHNIQDLAIDQDYKNILVYLVLGWKPYDPSEIDVD